MDSRASSAADGTEPVSAGNWRCCDRPGQPVGAFPRLPSRDSTTRNMEETGVLEKVNLSGFCCLALNQVGIQNDELIGMQTGPQVGLSGECPALLETTDDLVAAGKILNRVAMLWMGLQRAERPPTILARGPWSGPQRQVGCAGDTLLFPTSCTSCPPCGLLLLRGGPTIIGTESRVKPIGLGVPGSDRQSPTIFGARPLVRESSARKDTLASRKRPSDR